MPARQQTIFAAILAAGRASRFGATKQTARLNGVPLIRRAVATATEACETRVITVIGHDWPNVMKAMASDSGFVVVNDDHGQGLGSSIAVAAGACQRCADAMLLLFADQPLVTAEHLRTLLDSWSGADDEIVATAYKGTQGPPVLFPRGTFADLCQLHGDTGAQAVLRDGRFQLKTVRFEAAAVDIDTPADLVALT